MKNTVKSLLISVFALGALFMFLSNNNLSKIGEAAFSVATLEPTPPSNMKATNTTTANTSTSSAAANTAANANTFKPVETGGKTMKESFTLAQDSEDEKYGEAAFNHKTHAFEKYSPDGKSVIGCVDCHHTDQPKSALKLKLNPPLLTSERDVVLTFDSWKASPQKVKECRDCHFQDTNIPDDKENPTAKYTDGGKEVTKVLNNQLAYHINCNNCHDEALKIRPELKGKKGFASGSQQDCGICHKVKQ